MGKPAAFLVSLSLLLPGCILDQDSSQSQSLGDDVEDDGDEGGGDNDDCKIEDEAIGQDGVELQLGGKTVRFESWVPKADSDGEFVGFTLSLSGGDSVSYVVKASGELYASSDLTWSHPNGDSGSEAPGISNVDFCDDPDSGDDGGGDDGGGEDECEGDVDTGECDGDGGGGDGDGDGDGSGDGSGDGDGDCVPDVDTGECEVDDGGGDTGGVD
jgi:hypothetical protein